MPPDPRPSPAPGQEERDYRDDYPLSEAISDAYTEGLSNGQSWGARNLPTDERDYAMARADRLEADLSSRPLPAAGLSEEDYGRLHADHAIDCAARDWSGEPKECTCGAKELNAKLARLSSGAKAEGEEE